MELQTWELTDEQYKELETKAEELHTLCKKLQVPAIVALQIANEKETFSIEGYSSYDLPRICPNMIVFAAVFDVLLGSQIIEDEDMAKLTHMVYDLHHKYYPKQTNVEVSNAE